MRAQRTPLPTTTTQTRSLPPGNVIVLQSPVPYPYPAPTLACFGCNLIFILKKPIYICAFVAPLRVLQRFFVALLESQLNEGMKEAEREREKERQGAGRDWNSVGAQHGVCVI